MRIIYILFFSVLFVACSNDDEATKGSRYVDDVFSGVVITSDVVYGSNTDLLNQEIALTMDVYEPDGDDFSDRPVLLLAHGGAFIGGNKNDLSELCTAYAKKGYVVASMKYRLIDPLLIVGQVINDSIGFTEGVVMAIHDMKAAIRYLRDDALSSNNYGINQNQIFIGGISAGAIMACNAGLWSVTDMVPEYLEDILDENGGYEGNSNDLTVSSQVSGIISFSGSVLRDQWITNSDPPIFMVHEELDEVVPCKYESTDLFPFEILAYGSCDMEPRLQQVNQVYDFVLYQGANNHVGYFFNDDEATTLINETSGFLSELIVGM